MYWGERMKRVIAVFIILIVTFCGCSPFGYEKPLPESNIKVDQIPAKIEKADKEGITAGGYINAFVAKAVDGDTLNVKYMNGNYKVRLLDIDTPESVKEGVPVQEFSKEASEYTRRNTINTNIRLVFGKGLKDKYGRLLAYVILKDGGFLNAQLVRFGYARAEILAPNVEFADYFYKLQEEAINDKVGLWALPLNKIPFIKDKNGIYIPRYWENEKAS
jgi:micrococcal nuclease